MTLSHFSLAPIALGLMAAASVGHAQTVLSVSTWLPPAHGATMAQNQWCEALEKETKGGMECNLLPKAVSAPPGTFDAVRDGVVDVSYTVDGYTPGRFVFTQVAEFPFLGDSATATSVAFQRIYSKYFAPLGEHRGVKTLAVFTHGPGIIFTVKQPVNSSAEAAKLKFRIGGGNIESQQNVLRLRRVAVGQRGQAVELQVVYCKVETRKFQCCLLIVQRQRRGGVCVIDQIRAQVNRRVAVGRQPVQVADE